MTKASSQLASWQTFAKEIALGAGKLLNEAYLLPRELHFKTGLDGRPSSVTQADQASETYLVKALRNRYPEHGVFGEEGAAHNLDAELVWYVDPLDGTTNFWRHIPLFGISVGLAYNKRPVVGVLYFPQLNLLLEGHEGGGAYANGMAVRVSQRSLKQSLYYVSCQEARDGIKLPGLGAQAGWVRAIDASSYEFAQLAMGDAEIYTFFEKSPHDMVAGALLVQEAGGMVTDGSGQSWTTDSNVIIATNGVAHWEVIKGLASPDSATSSPHLQSLAR